MTGAVTSIVRPVDLCKVVLLPFITAKYEPVLVPESTVMFTLALCELEGRRLSWSGLMEMARLWSTCVVRDTLSLKL